MSVLVIIIVVAKIQTVWNDESYMWDTSISLSNLIQWL